MGEDTDVDHEHPRDTDEVRARDDQPTDATPERGAVLEDEERALLDTSRHKLSDRQAVAVLGAYLVFRTITTRVGFIFLIGLATDTPWAVPLLNNSLLPLVTVGTTTAGRPAMMTAVVAASVFMSLVAGSVLYWAGWRFGPELAKRAEAGNAAWASLWNPRQVARAHRWLERWGVFAVFLGRLVEFLTTPVVLVAGSSRMTLRKFLPAYLVGAAAYAGTTLWLGVRAASTWPWLPDRLESIAGWSVRIGLVLTVLLVAAFVFAPSAKGGGDAEDPG